MDSPAVAYNKLDDAQKEFFMEVANSPFSEQAMAFMDAYWEEIGTQAPFIFEVAWEVMKSVDMQMQGVIYLHKYKESSNLNDFEWALLFFEKLCKAVETQETEDRDANGEIVRVNGKPVMKKWSEIDFFSISMPSMMTAVARKQELTEKVDFNKDGSISMLEYLIYQFKRVSNAADFIFKGRAIKEGAAINSPERQQLELAQAALAEIQAKIAAYQGQMAQQQQIMDDFDNGVLDENGNRKVGMIKRQKAFFRLKELQGDAAFKQDLKKSLIDAEYKVKVAMKMMQAAMEKAKDDVETGGPAAIGISPGRVFWVDAAVQAEKKRIAGQGLRNLIARN
eukprot:augustus_masked-scaffold_1-processed-gene-30.12-mRNA-1 protein AED:1.00 eAED:1.00 QI:0/-1/0/0/-1/1/1/0/336